MLAAYLALLGRRGPLGAQAPPHHRRTSARPTTTRNCAPARPRRPCAFDPKGRKPAEFYEMTRRPAGDQRDDARVRRHGGAAQGARRPSRVAARAGAEGRCPVDPRHPSRIPCAAGAGVLLWALLLLTFFLHLRPENLVAGRLHHRGDRRVRGRRPPTRATKPNGPHHRPRRCRVLISAPSRWAWRAAVPSRCSTAGVLRVGRLRVVVVESVIACSVTYYADPPSPLTCLRLPLPPCFSIVMGPPRPDALGKRSSAWLIRGVAAFYSLCACECTATSTLTELV